MFNLSKIGLGGGAFGSSHLGYSFGKVSNETIFEILNYCSNNFLFDNEKINYIDLAPVYGFDTAEKTIGNILNSSNNLKKHFKIISKAGIDWHDNLRVNLSNEPKIIEKMIHKSLKNLKKESIDIYFLHWPDPRVKIEDSMIALSNLKSNGLISSIGLSNTNVEELKKALEIDQVDYIQNENNLFNPMDNNLIEYCRLHKIQIMSYATFDKGILTQRVFENRVYEKEDCRGHAPWWNKKLVKEKITKVNLLKKSIDELKCNLTTFCLYHSLKYKLLDSCLLGVKSIEDLKSVFLDYSRVKILNQEQIKRINSICESFMGLNEK